MDQKAEHFVSDKRLHGTQCAFMRLLEIGKWYLLPPANEGAGGNVFSKRVIRSAQLGGGGLGGCLTRRVFACVGGGGYTTPDTVNRQAVRILLECILVDTEVDVLKMQMISSKGIFFN